MSTVAVKMTQIYENVLCCMVHSISFDTGFLKLTYIVSESLNTLWVSNKTALLWIPKNDHKYDIIVMLVTVLLSVGCHRFRSILFICSKNFLM